MNLTSVEKTRIFPYWNCFNCFVKQRTSQTKTGGTQQLNKTCKLDYQQGDHKYKRLTCLQDLHISYEKFQIVHCIRGSPTNIKKYFVQIRTHAVLSNQVLRNTFYTFIAFIFSTAWNSSLNFIPCSGSASRSRARISTMCSFSPLQRKKYTWFV